ncbi:hypothetical protein [Desulfosporosinus nitroreducens]|uniref:Uncharacterized protein n=1 Tax=Desulfosporosinus nitroreducens TaxID=2018668 RepID=A0ABT8QSY1_9FIRM|nr:hypothetical protein [Desulfosporosinus nitroreducens]MDO0824405.1 hypothetical protein [Desulfosporosinus nitroreducens]
MSQQNSKRAKHERVGQILEMLQAGQPRDKIADQFGYSTWKSLDIYMRRHGFTWDSQRHIYTNAVSEVPLKKELAVPIDRDDDALTDVSPEEVVRLFSTGILDARDIAKRTGFPGHKEMASYMLRRGYVWSSTSLNYIDSNPSPQKTSLNSCTEAEDSLQVIDRVPTGHSLSEVLINDKYISLLEFLWESRNKLVKVIESLNDEDKIQVYPIPGQAKTKSIFLSDRLTDLMMALCDKHNLSQKQGYEAALVEYLSRNGFRDRVEELLDVRRI